MKDNNLEKIVIDDTVYSTSLTGKFQKRKPYVPYNPKLVKAVIPGVILELKVSRGQQVKRNEDLLILEAMKMRNSIIAPHDGVIKSVYVKPGKQVAKNELLIEFE